MPPFKNKKVNFIHNIGIVLNYKEDEQKKCEKMVKDSAVEDEEEKLQIMYEKCNDRPGWEYFNLWIWVRDKAAEVQKQYKELLMPLQKEINGKASRTIHAIRKFVEFKIMVLDKIQEYSVELWKRGLQPALLEKLQQFEKMTPKEKEKHIQKLKEQEERDDLQRRAEL